MRTSRFLQLSAALSMALFAGCGTSEQKYQERTTSIPTPVESIRTSLRGILVNGQTDSGTSLIKDDLEKLRGTANVDVDKLQKQLTELLASQNPTQVKAKANEMLNQLPK